MRTVYMRTLSSITHTHLTHSMVDIFQGADSTDLTDVFLERNIPSAIVIHDSWVKFRVQLFSVCLIALFNLLRNPTGRRGADCPSGAFECQIPRASPERLR